MHEPSVVAGVLLALLGGMFNGIFALPMRMMHKWKWENTWLVYSLVGMVLFPWIVAWLLTPHLGQVLGAAPLLLIGGFGLAWGIGSVFFGMGINLLGLGLGLALIMGIIAGVGSLIPMFVLEPAKAATRAGAFIFGGNALLILGIAFCARAGGMRERLRKQAQSASEVPESSTKRSSLLTGLLVAILSGLFSAMLNFSFAFSGQVQEQAVQLGASPATAGVVIFAIAVSTGYFANLAFCLWKIRGKGWEAFRAPHTGLYWGGAVLMGVLWFSSWIVYVVGASYLGASGKFIGWPVLMGGTIITSNIAGWLAGEWKGADRKILAHLIIGVLIILGAVVCIAQGN
jgi:L-rhamnose-H+ transport protein